MVCWWFKRQWWGAFDFLMLTESLLINKMKTEGTLIFPTFDTSSSLPQTCQQKPRLRLALAGTTEAHPPAHHQSEQSTQSPSHLSAVVALSSQRRLQVSVVAGWPCTARGHGWNQTWLTIYLPVSVSCADVHMAEEGAAVENRQHAEDRAADCMGETHRVALFPLSLTCLKV